MPLAILTISFVFWGLIPLHGITIGGIKSFPSISAYHVMLILITFSSLLTLAPFCREKKSPFSLFERIGIHHIVLSFAFVVANLLLAFVNNEIYWVLLISESSLLYLLICIYLLEAHVSYETILRAIVCGGVVLILADLCSYAAGNPVIQHSDWLDYGYGGIGVKSTFQNHESGMTLSLAAVYLLSYCGKINRVYEKLFERAVWFFIVLSQSRSGIVAILILSFSRYSNEIRQFLCSVARIVRFRHKRQFVYILFFFLCGIVFYAILQYLIEARVSTVGIRFMQYQILVQNLPEFAFGGLINIWDELSGGIDAHSVVIQYAIHYGYTGIALFLMLQLQIVKRIMDMVKTGGDFRLLMLSVGMAAALLCESLLGPEIPAKWMHLCLIVLNLTFINCCCTGKKP